MGFEDEVWWSRFEQPSMHTWTQRDRPVRLVEQVERPVAKTQGTHGKGTKEPKALACYGLDLHLRGEGGSVERRVWLRFVDGRPVSEITCRYLAWCCEKLGGLGKEALLLVWDNAGCHTSAAVREWIGTHNRRVRWSGKGVRILLCLLPKKSPWLNPIEPKWVHSRRKIVEPDWLLSAAELEGRVYDCFGCDHQDRPPSHNRPLDYALGHEGALEVPRFSGSSEDLMKPARCSGRAHPQRPRQYNM